MVVNLANEQLATMCHELFSSCRQAIVTNTNDKLTQPIGEWVIAGRDL